MSNARTVEERADSAWQRIAQHLTENPDHNMLATECFTQIIRSEFYDVKALVEAAGQARTQKGDWLAALDAALKPFEK